jgi:tctex1 domain-containing protein 2
LSTIRPCSKVLAEQVLSRVRELGYNRYKLIVQTTVGQRLGQTIRILSRALWNTKTDSFASINYESNSMFIVISVFGFYFE